MQMFILKSLVLALVLASQNSLSAQNDTVEAVFFELATDLPNDSTKVLAEVMFQNDLAGLCRDLDICLKRASKMEDAKYILHYTITKSTESGDKCEDFRREFGTFNQETGKFEAQCVYYQSALLNRDRHFVVFGGRVCLCGELANPLLAPKPKIKPTPKGRAKVWPDEAVEEIERLQKYRKA